jgi:hypothetical protein
MSSENDNKPDPLKRNPEFQDKDLLSHREWEIDDYN